MAQLMDKKEILADLLDGKKISEEEYLAADGEFDGIKYELVNGRLMSLGMSVKKVARYGAFLAKLFEAYFVDNPNTVKGTLLTQFMISTTGEQYRKNYRKPDIMIIVNDTLKDKDNKTDRMDIAVELISEGDKTRDHRDKKKEYAQKQAEYYFIIEELSEDSKFYQLNPDGQYEEMTVTDHDLVEISLYPNLQFRLSDLFSSKTIEELSNDPLYEQSFGYLRKIGKQEGIHIGEEKRNQEIARNLKSMGIAIEQIVKATGLSQENIENL